MPAADSLHVAGLAPAYQWVLLFACERIFETESGVMCIFMYSGQDVD